MKIKALTAVQAADCSSSHILHRKPQHMVLHRPEKAHVDVSEVKQLLKRGITPLHIQQFNLLFEHQAF